MTIGVVATGKDVAHKVVQVFRAIEPIATGAIGGFVTMVVITDSGDIHYFETQNGGVSELCEDVLAISNTTQIGLISSGAYRPGPLSRFLAWDKEGNIVSGHRFPQSSDSTGVPLNQRLLQTIQEFQGINNSRLTDLININPTVDAGFIATDKQGNLFQADTMFVQRRPDTFTLCKQDRNRSVGVTMNSIASAEQVARLICDIVMAEDKASPRITLGADATIVASKREAINITASNRVISVETDDPGYFLDKHEGSLFIVGTPVYRLGELVGFVKEEPYVLCNFGQIKFLCGSEEVLLSIELA